MIRSKTKLIPFMRHRQGRAVACPARRNSRYYSMRARQSCRWYGDFGTTVTIPATTLPGTHTVIARVPTSGTSYGTTLTVSHEWDQFGFAADHNRFNPCEQTLQSNNISQLTQAWVDGLSFQAPVASV